VVVPGICLLNWHKHGVFGHNCFGFAEASDRACFLLTLPFSGLWEFCR
jgi:hypothetical protein